MKRIILPILILFMFTSCDWSHFYQAETGTANFKIEIQREFKSPSDLRARTIEVPSEWKHIFVDEAKMKIRNVENLREFELSFNPNVDESISIDLPYGNYIYEYTPNSVGDLSPTLPFSISGNFNISSIDTLINASASTTYGLITVFDSYVDSVRINNTIINTKNNGFFYSYVSSGDKALQITESVFGDKIDRTLSVKPYDHYNFVLNFVQGNVSFVEMLLQPFEYIKEDIGISGTKEFNFGTELTAIAEPNEGFVFSHWELNGQKISGGPELKLTMPNNDVNLVAHFKPTN